ncbi:PREDICTED: putative uncharacterized protein DDB_G0274405 [Polistes dominula]|uniref:Uncharacterized protein n=1 Tax=Polistes dominula TaxID=743375 RepID=A0ABM1J770_POLDO|nr:PREDICTED: putative uncharacterized protein DDB_G0274405 [Polistes dominula]
MEDKNVNLNNYPDCTVRSTTSIRSKKIYESLNNKTNTTCCLINNKSICNNEYQKKVKEYFNDDLDNIKYSREDVVNVAEERNIHHIDFNSVQNTNTTNLFEKHVPLRILIKQMIDEIFGKSSINDKEEENVEEIDLHNTSDKINHSEQSLKLIIKNEDNIDSTIDTNDNTATSDETFSNPTKCNDKLISIAEETENYSSSNCNIVENTGTNLSKLLKYDEEFNKRLNNDNNNDSSTIIAKIHKNTINPSVLFNIDENNDEELDDDSLKDFVKMESLLINQKTNIDNKCVDLEIVNDSMNNLSFDRKEDQTMNIFYISNEKNIIENNDESFHEQSNLSEREKEIKEITTFNDNSISNIDSSTKKKKKFINEVTINLQTPCKRRTCTTFYQISLLKRTPKLSKNTRIVTPRKNSTELTHKSIKHANISSTNLTNVSKKKTTTSKISKPQQEIRAKLFKSRDINKKQQMLIPQFIFTPATPE